MATAATPLRATGTAELLKFSYVALSVEASQLAPLSVGLEEILGEDYAELKANRDARDGEGRYHMTAIEPREFRKLSKELKAQGRRLELPQGPIELEILGIGTAESGNSQTWFAVCRSEAVAAWRSALELPPKDLHITLAFGAGGDVHGVAKGVSSLIAA